MGIAALFKDTQGRTWISHDIINSYFLSRWDPATGEMKHYRTYSIESMYEDKQGVLWMGADYALYRYDPGEDYFSVTPTRITGNSILTTPSFL